MVKWIDPEQSKSQDATLSDNLKGPAMNVEGLALMIPIVAIVFSLSIPLVAILSDAA